MHRLSPTLTAYLGRQFLLNVGIVFLVLLWLLFMIDLVELVRRAVGRESAT
ncbi:MAG: LPS export ABC transporter permease LptG, partial [Alphaproteobacteria bacterium]|nr:LPS export ABC transporter permease LptG [Alphaproteobacteria bacterium]